MLTIKLPISEAQTFEVQALKFGPIKISGRDYTVYLVPVEKVSIDKLEFEVT